jgi:AraC-like DNA-binding protein
LDAPVCFDRPATGIILDSAAVDIKIVDADPLIFELATFYIENRFPRIFQPMVEQVRNQVARLLEAGEDCSREEVASQLGVHSRTMQRRLHEVHTCFDTIRDEVRRDLAMRVLSKTDLPISRLAEMLGYAEVSALSRSCHRWFARSPSRLRKEWGEVIA